MLRATFDNGKGKQRELVLPWYAAFAGAPPRKPKVDPKQKPCNSCKGQGKCSTCAGKGKAGGGNQNQKGGGNQNNNQNNNNNSGNNQSHSTSDPEIYSKEDDDKLLELKAAGTPWKEILKAINKTSQTQLKERYNSLSGGAGGGQGGNNQQGKGGGKGQGNKGDLSTKMAKELVKEEAHKWFRMASRHFDQTGERISAEKAQQMYGK